MSITVLAISGSLREVSSNTRVLQAVQLLAPKDVHIHLYNGLAELPHFNPDLEANEPASVTELRKQVRECDGILICSPEYAHCVPGSLKNMLDWLVGGSEFIEKPVAIINASPRSTYAQASLLETVTIMSARVIKEASVAIPVWGLKLDAEGIAQHPEIGPMLSQALHHFCAIIH